MKTSVSGFHRKKCAKLYAYMNIFNRWRNRKCWKTHHLKYSKWHARKGKPSFIDLMVA